MMRACIAAGMFTLHVAAFGQADVATGIPPTAIEQPQAADNAIILPAMMTVELEIVEALNSKTSQTGQMFDIRLNAPITMDGRIVVPAGTMGRGEVIHAAKARAAGKAGELIVNARYLDFQGIRLPLRTMKYGKGATGKSNVDEAAAVGLVVATPLILFITGGQVDIPAGMPAVAKLADDVRIELVQQNLQQEGSP